MSAKPSLLNDARYLPFVERYAFDVMAFATEVCGLVPTEEQARVFRAMVQPGADVHTNFTDSYACSDAPVALPPMTVAVVALWHLLTRPRSNTYIAVPVMRAWRQLLPDLQFVLNLVGGSAYRWLADYVAVRRDRLVVWAHTNQWFITVRSAQAQAPENLAGTNAEHLLWIVLDTHEVAPVCLQVIRGSLTYEENRLLQTSRWCKPDRYMAIAPAQVGADRTVATVLDGDKVVAVGGCRLVLVDPEATAP